MYVYALKNKKTDDFDLPIVAHDIFEFSLELINRVIRSDNPYYIFFLADCDVYEIGQYSSANLVPLFAYEIPVLLDWDVLVDTPWPSCFEKMFKEKFPDRFDKTLMEEK